MGMGMGMGMGMDCIGVDDAVTIVTAVCVVIGGWIGFVMICGFSKV
jgi:hypothetical protein